MRKLKITLLVLMTIGFLLVIACEINNHVGNCQIEGNIQGLGTTLALVTGGSDTYSEMFYKVILIRNGSFSFKASLSQPGGGRIISRNMFFKLKSGKLQWMRSRILDFHLNPNEHILINGNMKPFSIDYSVSGNRLSEQHSQFRKENVSLLEKETQLAIALDSLANSKAPTSRIESTNRAFDQVREHYNYQRLLYAKHYPSLAIAAIYLQSQPEDTIRKYFPLLTDKVNFMSA